MPRLAFLVLISVLLSACAHTADGSRFADPSIQVMTFNIRLDTASDGANAWPKRKELVAELIRHEAPDILGMQEVLLGQKRYLEDQLPGYKLVGVGRDDGKDAGEFAPLAWRTDRFELVRHGTFWLSPTPDVPSTGWDAALPRVATWAILHDRVSGREIRMLNTHFDHVGVEARANSARLITDWVATGPGNNLPTVVLGDFNVTPASEPFMILTGDGQGKLVESGVSSKTGTYGPPGTFNGWRIDSAAAAPIDHVFVTRNISVASHATVTQHWSGRLPSDHYPVVVKLELEPSSER